MEMILDIISPLPPWVAHYCGQSFLHLAVAESKSHNVTPAEVYFHEVGAVDSIVDVCGFWCMLYLMGVQARNVSCSKLPTSEGTVKTDHGILPVPAPATARLMEGFDVTEGPRTAWGELCTPTGVAILRAALWDAEGERVDPGRVGRWKGRAGKKASDVFMQLGVHKIVDVPNQLGTFIHRPIRPGRAGRKRKE